MEMEEENKMTAVEWLVDELLSGKPLMPSLIEQAKKIERNQRIKDYDAGWYNGFKYADGSNNKITAAQHVDNIESNEKI
jgi:hypothetical protein